MHNNRVMATNLIISPRPVSSDDVLLSPNCFKVSVANPDHVICRELGVMWHHSGKDKILTEYSMSELIDMYHTCYQ